MPLQSRPLLWPSDSKIPHLATYISAWVFLVTFSISQMASFEVEFISNTSFISHQFELKGWSLVLLSPVPSFLDYQHPPPTITRDESTTLYTSSQFTFQVHSWPCTITCNYMYLPVYYQSIFLPPKSCYQPIHLFIPKQPSIFSDPFFQQLQGARIIHYVSFWKHYGG